MNARPLQGRPGGFNHDEPTFAMSPVDTTRQLQGVGSRRPEPAHHVNGRSPAERRLRRAVSATAAAVAITAGAVVAAATGVLPGRSTGVAAAGQASTDPAPGLLSQSGGGPGSAAYTVAGHDFTIEVTDPTRPCWLSVTTDGATRYAGVLAPGATVKASARDAAAIDVGAGGSTVVVSVGGRTQELTPASAPYGITLSAR